MLSILKAEFCIHLYISKPQPSIQKTYIEYLVIKCRNVTEETTMMLKFGLKDMTFQIEKMNL